MIPIAKSSTGLEQIHGISRQPLQGITAGEDLPAESAVIIYGRLNHLALGTLVAVARGFASDVFVITNPDDVRICNLVRSLGARAICQGSDPTVGAVFTSYGAIVVMRGDGSDDPYHIPELLYHARNEKDAAIVPACKFFDPDESVRLLNNHQAQPVASGFVALSGHAARGMKLKTGDLGRQIADYVKSANLNVRSASSAVFEAYRIGVVVPAYNEELLLGQTVRGIPEYVTKIYVIDDCSTDGTPDVIRQLDDPRVVSIRHEANKGVGGSIIDGYRMALRDGMDLVAVMAGDDQMDPAELPRLLLPVVEGKADYAKGNRLLNRGMRNGMSAWRQFGNTMLTMLNKIGSGYWQISDPQNGYTVISRRALELLDLDAVYTYYGYCNDLLVKLNTIGLRTLDVPIPARYGNEKSKIRYGRFITRVSPMLFRSFLQRLRVKYTVLDFHPLVIFYAAGMLMAPAGILLGLLSIVLLAFAPGTFVPLGLSALIVEFFGLQFLLSAMALDREEDRRMRANTGRFQ